MSSTYNTKKGKKGEDLAVRFLTTRGYEMLERNYRFGRSEIDIIARLGEMVVFVEVKFRKSDLYGHPEESISDKKIDQIKLASDQYVFQKNWHGPIR
ncbi:MAG: YraN family protein, partial [Cytophagales bacterium]|nr:YraN family protein [Cytophagales bacterium]